MASLWKRSGSKYYYACFSDANGRRLKISTKSRDRAKAMRMALDLEKAANAARNKDLSLEIMRETLNTFARQTGSSELIVYTLRTWLNDFTAHTGETKSVATAKRYTQVTRDFMAFLGTKADEPLASIGPVEVRNFRAHLIESRGLSPRTANLSLKALGAAFNRAQRQGLIQHAPTKTLDVLPVENIDKDAFTPAMVGRLLIAAGDTPWHGMILLGFYSGLRLGDCATLRWENIDLAKEALTLRTKKTKRALVVPIHPSLRDYLLKLPSVDDPKTFLFPDLAPLGSGGRFGLTGRFKAIMQAAGIKGRLLEGQRQRAVSSLSFHSLRHSFNSMMANAGVSQELRQELTGHSSPAVNKIYTHLELEPLRKAVESLPGIDIRSTSGG